MGAGIDTWPRSLTLVRIRAAYHVCAKLASHRRPDSCIRERRMYPDRGRPIHRSRACRRTMIPSPFFSRPAAAGELLSLARSHRARASHPAAASAPRLRHVARWRRHDRRLAAERAAILTRAGRRQGGRPAAAGDRRHPRSCSTSGACRSSIASTSSRPAGGTARMPRAMPRSWNERSASASPGAQ
jgi:hypothetical protein